MADVINISDLLAAKQDYIPTTWHDKVVDPEGDNSHPGVKFTARRANKLEKAADDAHDRLNQLVNYTEEADRAQKNMRFEILLLKASVTSGLTSNILVENFETLDGIVLIAGAHDANLQRIYLP